MKTSQLLKHFETCYYGKQTAVIFLLFIQPPKQGIFFPLSPSWAPQQGVCNPMNGICFKLGSQLFFIGGLATQDYDLTVMCGLTFLILSLLRHVALFFLMDQLRHWIVFLKHLRTFIFLLLNHSFIGICTLSSQSCTLGFLHFFFLNK